MNSGKSLNDTQWEKIGKNSTLVENALILAKRDLKTAKKVFLENDFDWCLAIAYNAMLQSARALMFFKGFRPKGANQHAAVIKFMKNFYAKEMEESLLYAFNKTRKKRHLSVYEQAEIVSKEEAQNTLEKAQKMIKKAQEIMEKKQ